MTGYIYSVKMINSVVLKKENNGTCCSNDVQAPKERLGYTLKYLYTPCLALVWPAVPIMYLPMPYRFSSRLVVLLICFCSVQRCCTFPFSTEELSTARTECCSD